MNTWNINLDVSKSTAYNVPVIISQGDKAGTTILATIFDHGTQCTLTGMTAKFMLRSGAGYFEDASCTVSGSTITYVVDEQHAASVAGMAQAYFALYQGSTHVYSTSRFDVKVLRAASSGADPAQSYSDDIVAATQAARAATSRVEDAIDAMGDISEIAVPLMSADVRGGAKLGEGLAITDGALGIDPAPHQSTGEVRGSIASLTAKGHAEQVSTTGKNLLDSSSIVIGKAWDGSSSATNGYVVIHVQASMQYTYSAQSEYGATAVYLRTDSPRFISSEIVDGGKTITTPSECSEIRIQFTTARDSSGSTVSNPPNFAASMVTNPQLELGSTATDYEPYSNNVPSPSPDWPQEIQVVRGRNLAVIDANHIEKPSWYAGGWLDTTLQGNGIRVARSYSNGNAGGFYVTSMKAGQYVVSMTVDNPDCSNAFKIYIYVKYEGSSTTAVIVNNATVPLIGNKLLLAFTLDNDCEGVAIRPVAYYFNSGYTYADFSDIQLELGSTATPYVPYGHVGMEAQGKNLVFGMTNKYSTNNNNVWSITSSPNTLSALACVEPNKTYTFKRVGGNRTIIVIVDSGNPTSITRFIVNDSTLTSYTFTTSDNEYHVMIYVSNDKNTNPVTSVQLERGSTATEYEPYYHSTTPIPLPQRGWVASLPDGTADVLTLDGAGKVEWKLNDDEVVLDGTQLFWSYDWLSTSGTSGCQIVLPTAPKSPVSGAVTLPSYASRFLLRKHNELYGAVYDTGFAFPPSNTAKLIELRVNESGINTAALWQSWLSTHPVTVLYPLATPVTEERGYVDMPRISGSVTVSIPELDALGVTYLIGDSVRDMAEQYYARARSEYEDRIAALEAAVSEIIAG